MSCFRDVIQGLCHARGEKLQMVNVSETVIGSRWSLSSAFSALDLRYWSTLTRGNDAYMYVYTMIQTTVILLRILKTEKIIKKTFYLPGSGDFS